MAIDYSVVLDKNERERMLKEGYLPEVIDWHAKERYERLVDEFKWKNTILKYYYEPASYFDFVADVFPDLEKLMVITGETSYSEMEIDELMEYQALRNDVYVTPASFIQGCYQAVTCKDIYALVVDIDKIKPETLENIIKNGNLGNMTPMPTYIVNSGSGVHFYYVFEEAVPHYFGNQRILKTMYNKICGITKSNVYAKTDWHAITQPFRLPGTQTKLGQVVTAWKSGEKWSAKTFAKRLGVDAEELNLQRNPLIPQKEYKKLKEQRTASRTGQQKKEKKKWVSSMAGKIGFYEFCLRRCYEKTPEGTRYRSMMALTVVARKVEYPKDQLEKDLLKLVEHYNSTGSYMRQSEVKKAIRMYNEKALKTPSKTLESWFGWEFDRLAAKIKAKQLESKKKPVKRTRAEILDRARRIQEIDYPDGEWRNKEGRPTAEQQVRDWQEDHPSGKKADCIRETGLSKPTVYKWWNYET